MTQKHPDDTLGFLLAVGGCRAQETSMVKIVTSHSRCEDCLQAMPLRLARNLKKFYSTGLVVAGVTCGALKVMNFN